jgi:hypothetical protein
MNHRFPLLLLGLLACAAPLVHAWLGNEPDPPPALPGADDDMLGEAEPDAILAPDVEPLPGSAPATETAPLADADPGAEPPMRTETSLAEASHGPLLLVLAGDPPQPVADAEVLTIEAAAAGAFFDRIREPPPPSEQIPERIGAVSRTGADGKVQLPRIAEQLLVAGRKGGLFGFVALGRRSGDEVQLQLQQDATLTIEVQDADGSPAAGVPLAIHQGAPDKASTILRLATDAQGRAFARHFQLAIDRERPQQFCAAVALLLPQPVAVAFPRDPLPEEALRLVLPGTGRVELRLIGPAGIPLVAEAALSLMPATPRDLAGLPLERNFDRQRRNKPLGTAPVVVEPVGLGLQFVYGAWLASDLRGNGDRGFRGAPFAGPVGPGDTVHVPVVLPPDHGVLAGRITVPGAKLTEPRLRVLLRDPAGGTTFRSLRCLADGTFDLALRLPSAIAYELDLVSAQAGVTFGARPGRVRLGPGERTDLGAVVLEPLPALATGRILDDLGEPVPNARVSAQAIVIGNDGDPRNNGFRDLPGLATASAADGSFALWSMPLPTAFRLQARASHHLATETGLLTRAEHVELRLLRTATLTGQVLLPEWLPDQALSIALESTADRRQRHGDRLRRRGQGRFHFAEIPPGRYDLRVQLRNLAQPLLHLEGLELQPGDNTVPELAPLDLRAGLYRYRLRAFDVGGRPLALDGPVVLRSRTSEGREQHRGFRWRKGMAELITGSPSIEITAFARGCAPITAILGPGEHPLYFQPLNPVLVHVPGLRYVCGPVRRIRVSMILAGDTGWPDSLSGQDQASGDEFSFPRWDLGKSNGGWLSAADRTEVPLVKNGRYDVVLRIYEDGSERSSQVGVGLGPIDVIVDGREPREHTLAFDAAAVANAVAELDRRAWQRAQSAAAGDPRRSAR